MFSFCAIASVHGVISSPACAPTMVTPRILPLRRRDHLDVAVGGALGHGAVVVVIGPAHDAQLLVALRARLRLGEAGLRQLRLGIGHPRNGVHVHLHRQAEQRVPDHQAGMIVGGVGELRLAGGDIADGVDAPVAGLQLAIDRDAGAVVAHAGRFEDRGRRPWPCGRWRPADACLRPSPARCRPSMVTATLPPRARPSPP